MPPKRTANQGMGCAGVLAGLGCSFGALIVGVGIWLVLELGIRLVSLVLGRFHYWPATLAGCAGFLFICAAGTTVLVLHQRRHRKWLVPVAPRTVAVTKHK